MPHDGTDGTAMEPAAAPRIPLATYRLQFNRGFTFEDAARLVPYLDALGITDLYASSYLAARPGSRHGYDIVDHTTLNPEIGSPETYDRMVSALHERRMGHILDVVPNHMGIAEGANRWWNDVLENGPSSPYAEFFDIDWQPVERHLANKVLLPILGDQYGRVLENQELILELEGGAFRIRYHDTRLPVEPRSATIVLNHGLPFLHDALAAESPALQDYQSIITALANLPGVTDTAPERVRERMREKDVVRRRLTQLVQSDAAVRTCLDETLRAFNGKRGNPRSFDLLDRLLAEQTYRLAHWRVAGEEINYRRFFDVNELAAIRMEIPAVFRDTHRLILELVDAGKVTGLRIDHPDGLYDPRRYFLALQRQRVEQLARMRRPGDGGAAEEALAAAAGEVAAAFDARCADDPALPGCRPLYLIAEKILGKGERLPARWAVHGTTGYEFLNLVGGLFVDSANARAMTAAYAASTGERTAYADLVYESKKLILEVSMSSELSVLGHAMSRLAERSRYSRDFPRKSLTDALREVIACFPLYRTYIEDTGQEVALQDRACIEVAAAFAKRRNPATSVSIFDFVRDVLLLRAPDTADDEYRRDQRAFVQKFQQLTSPVMAKGAEDTAFYRYNRLVSLNEVGATRSSSAYRWTTFTHGAPPARRRGPARCPRRPPTTPSAARTCGRGSTSSRKCRAPGGTPCVAGTGGIAAMPPSSRAGGRPSATRSTSSIRPCSGPGHSARSRPTPVPISPPASRRTWPRPARKPRSTRAGSTRTRHTTKRCGASSSVSSTPWHPRAFWPTSPPSVSRWPASEWSIASLKYCSRSPRQAAPTSTRAPSSGT